MQGNQQVSVEYPVLSTQHMSAISGVREKLDFLKTTSFEAALRFFLDVNKLVQFLKTDSRYSQIYEKSFPQTTLVEQINACYVPGDYALTRYKVLNAAYGIAEQAHDYLQQDIIILQNPVAQEFPNFELTAYYISVVKTMEPAFHALKYTGHLYNGLTFYEQVKPAEIIYGKPGVKVAG